MYRHIEKYFILTLLGIRFPTSFSISLSPKNHLILTQTSTHKDLEQEEIIDIHKITNNSLWDQNETIDIALGISSPPNSLVYGREAARSYKTGARPSTT